MIHVHQCCIPLHRRPRGRSGQMAADDDAARSQAMMRGALREARAASMLAHPNIVTM